MTQKLEGLETLRGLAALVVLGGHLLIGFIPGRLGFSPGTEATGLIGSPLFVFVNGSAAVSVFFVLSGFVLSWSTFNRIDDTAMVRNLLKRWPRLAGPSTVAALGSCLILLIGGHPFVDAGQTLGSDWLQHFGGAPYVPQADPWPAFLQGAFFTFFRGDFSYNSVIWTMRLELMGSFLIFMLAPFLARAGGRVLPMAIAVLVSVALHKLEPRLAEFVIGAALACLLSRGFPDIPLSAAVPLFACAIFCLGYYAPRGAYHWLPFKNGLFYVWDIGAALLILIALRNPYFRRMLSGGWARWLGSMSFPIYLVHTPILCIVGSWTFIALQADASPRNAILGAWVISLMVILPSALLLRMFERSWVAMVNRVSYRVVPRQGGPAA